MKIFKKSFVFMILCLMIGLAVLFNPVNIYVYASEQDELDENDDTFVDPTIYSGYGCNNGIDLKEENMDHDGNAAIENNYGLGCGSTCGTSREGGYSLSYPTGCRNWQLLPSLYNLNKYYIDESTLDNLTNEQKNIFIQYVDKAANEWNSVRIADYDGQIVNLEKQTSAGINIVTIKYNPNLEDGVRGRFDPFSLYHVIEIKQYNDYESMMHEFGHMIGLQDLDLFNSPATHISLMGYAGNGDLHYQDIQGVAVANNKHSIHDFQRYWFDGTKYNYVCFYCDATDSLDSTSRGGSHLEFSSNCLHDYMDLASAGDRHWQKCTKCYRVIESEFRVNVLSMDRVEIIGLVDERTTITIPREIDGKTVVAIEENAFKNHSNLVSVNFQNNCNISTICNSAFENCSSLTTITIPNSVTYLGSSTFKNCSNLTTITIPSSVTDIESNIFENCSSLTTITIPSSVTYLGSNAFKNCISLVSVNIQREGNDITYVQENVFDGCSNSLQIIVPRNKLVEYANSDYLKVYSSKIVPNNNNFEEINLNCLVDNDKSIYLNTGYNMLYKLDVDCSKSYKFTSDDDVLISIYNSNMQQLYLGEKNISGFLSCGTYYLDVRFNSNTESGFIDINYTLTWQSNETLILTNSMTNIFSDLHLINDNFYHGRLYLLNEQGAGFFNFSLNIYTNIIYPENAIQVYSDSERTNLLNRYPIENIDYGASSIRKENQMCVYLPESGYYYINILLPAGSYSFVEFNVSNIDSQEIDYSISILNNSLKVLFENKNTISYFKEVTMSHTSKIQFDIFTSGNFTENIPVYVFKKNIINEENIGSTFDEIELQYVDYITTIDTSPVFTINLPAGTYYFGFSDNIKNINISFSLVRIVDDTIDKDNTLVADPYHEGYTLGSEVTLNNGLCDEYTITEGFTRNIYLMVEDRVLQPMSRLDYDWYSSCESVAVVTNYGTVLAKNVETDTQVTIYAILKEDPSIIYRKTFTILNDLSTEEIEITCDMSYSYSNLNEIYKLELNSSNSPFPMIQYYEWSVENQDEDLIVEINNWGYVSSNGVGNVVAIGTYTLNPRVIIYINLTITN